MNRFWNEMEEFYSRQHEEKVEEWRCDQEVDDGQAGRSWKPRRGRRQDILLQLRFLILLRKHLFNSKLPKQRNPSKAGHNLSGGLADIADASVHPTDSSP